MAAFSPNKDNYGSVLGITDCGGNMGGARSLACESLEKEEELVVAALATMAGSAVHVHERRL